MPDEYRKSLTWDWGMKLAKPAELTQEIGIPVYFCDPQCPWQWGTNENTNGLIRQYFPKKKDLSEHSQDKLNKVATQLNERPRKSLKFKTPSHKIEKSVAVITWTYSSLYKKRILFFEIGQLAFKCLHFIRVFLMKLQTLNGWELVPSQRLKGRRQL